MRLLLLTASAAALVLASPALAQDMAPPDDGSADQSYDQGYADDGYGDPGGYGAVEPSDDMSDYPDAYPEGGYDDSSDYGMGGGPEDLTPPDDSDYDPAPPGYEGQPYDPLAGDDYIPAEPDGRMDEPYDDSPPPPSDGTDVLADRQADLEARIRSAADQGRVNPDLANNALIELDSIRTQQRELVARDGVLTATTRGFIEDRLDVLEGRLERMGAR